MAWLAGSAVRRSHRWLVAGIALTLALAAAALLVSVAAAAVARAEALPCSRPPDPEARRLMAGIEHEQRTGTHVVHMQIRTRYPDGHPLAHSTDTPPDPKSLWGVVDTDPRETRTIYVFSGPGRLAGTTLLMRDRIGTLEGDAMWLYLRSFGNLSQIASTARRRTVVPGTSLTYEDAKGFIATDKYDFSFEGKHGPAAAEVEILACPATPALASDLGYRELRVTVDPARRLVRAIDYRDLNGKPLKRYRVEQTQQLEDRWLPKQVILEHLADGTITPIQYEHWLPPGRPPSGLYEASVDRETFRPRIVRYLESLELADPIRAELEQADARVKRWEEKWGSKALDGPGDEPNAGK